MKKLVPSILALAIITAFTSCKKSYSCECMTTLKDPSTGVTETRTETQSMSEKMKTKQAQSACNQTSKQITENIYYFADASLDVTSICSLK